ncbi:MAG: aminotransferase class I/II-fold pyridoxal phosphate-dependent enzyme [Phycisphaeraceae bacterium]
MDTDRANPLDAACDAELRQLAELDRRRSLRTMTPGDNHVDINGKQLLNLASNDYLGLSRHPKLIAAAADATQRFGVGAGASRLVSGTSPLHDRVEQRFAAFKHAEACLLLPTGYVANLAVLTTLAGPGDLIVLDKLVHASLIDAARASGAEVRTFTHLDLQRAERLLSKSCDGRRLLVTDSVFSMDGDCADLPALCDLADRTNAILLVDEAHGTGVLGATGGGLAEAQGVAERVYHCGAGGVVVSTASKALGSLGGLITSSQPVIDLLINQARSFIYSTAVPPAQAAAIDAAIDVVRDEPQRRKRLQALSMHARDSLLQRGWPILLQAAQQPPSPIIPLIVGEPSSALTLASRLESKSIFAPAIRPPTVAPGSARVRISLNAELTDDELERVLDAVGTPGG